MGSKDKDISVLVDAWGSTDELAAHETAVLAERLKQIIELAYKAKGEQKDLLMWMCL